MGNDENAVVVEAIAGVMVPTLAALEKLNHVSRYLHPPALKSLIGGIAGADKPARDGLRQFSDTDVPDELHDFGNQLGVVVEFVGKAFEGLEGSVGGDPNEVFSAYQALRNYTRAIEALYPLAAMLPAVSRFFLEPAMREDSELLEKLARADPAGEDVGVLHVDNSRDERGGFSLYIPEYFNPEFRPVVVTIFGGGSCIS